MNSSVGIYICSAHRADKLVTHTHMSDTLQEQVTYVVPYEEQDIYRNALANSRCVVLPAPEGIQCRSPKLQWAIHQDTHPFFITLDDDVDFFVRTLDKKLIRASEDDVDIIFHEFNSALFSGIPFVGISGRYGNNTVDEDYRDIGRVSRVWGFDRSIYLKLGIDIVPFPEVGFDDFHIILSFLENGYSNRIFYKYAQDDKGSNTPGGCSSYRTYEVQERGAHWLKEQHPHFVEIVEKTTKVAWPGMRKNAKGENVRTDVRIQWAKAYAAGLGKRRGGFMSF